MIGTPRLLISDDDQAFRETLQSVFEARGFATELAADGAEAVEIVRVRSIHVVLMDFHMPKMSGLEAIREIKSLRESMPCILISAALTDELPLPQDDLFSALPKPVSHHDVRQTVVDALQTVYGWSG